MYGRRGRRNSDDSGLGCLVLIIIAMIAMPLTGLYLALNKESDETTKGIGWILVIIGSIFWIYVAAKGGS